MTSHLERLGRNLARVEEDLRRLARANNLGHSAIEGGAIQQYTGDGTLGSIIGEQYDGSNGAVVVSGPRPPQPAAPTAYGTVGGIGVRYDGTFVGGLSVVAPMDFSSFEIHVSTTPDFSALFFDTLKTNITSARGGEVLIPLEPGTYYVRLVTRTLSGGTSLPSPPAGPVEATKIRVEDLGFEIGDLAGNTISRGDTAPTSPTYGDLWLQTPDNVAYQWSPGTPDSWVKVQDQNIVKAINDAADAAGLANAAGLTASDAKTLAGTAQTTANQANTAAQAASSAAALAQSTANNKVTVYRQTTAPTGGSYVVNDLWMDTDANNQLFAWSGGAWVASDDQRIATALTNASSAQGVAGAKTTLFAQTSAPASTGRVVGDTWIDTDDSNKVYVWSGSAWTVTLFGAAALGATARQLGAVTTYRQSAAPTGTLIAGDLWIDSDDNKLYSYSGTAWVASQDVGIQTALTNAGTAQSTANAKTTTYYQISAPATTGRVTGDLWVDTDDGNKIYTWSGTAWTATLLASQALSATARQLGAITIFRQATQPASGMISGDYWIDSDDNQPYYYTGAAWVVSRDAAVNTALTNAATAQATADGKAVIYYQTTAPTGRTASDVGDEWVDTDDAYVTYTWSGTAWVKNAISTSSFQPNSVVASSVMATGSVTAALLEAILVLATTIVAGDPTKTHVKIKNDGVYVYSMDPVATNPPYEVVRMGTASNDFFGISDATGLLQLSLDMTGAVNARTANFRQDIVVAGRKLLDGILTQIPGGGGSGTAAPGARNYVGWDTTGTAVISNVTTEVGLIEVQVTVEANRLYWIVPSLYWTAANTGTYLVVTVRDGGTSAPTVNSPIVAQDFFSSGNNAGWTLLAERHRPWRFGTGGTHRLLLTVAGGAGAINAVTVGSQVPMLTVVDLGPDYGNGATVNRGGGGVAPPPPRQQYDTGWLAPDGYRSYQGGGGVRSDTTDVVQGWDPSGFNGDGSGLIWWNSKIPSITGTVDKVWVWLQSNSTYYNSGGTGIIAPIRSGAGYPVSAGQVAAPIQYGTFPKPGSLQMDLSGWASLFHNNAGANRAMGISVGPGGGTNEQFYVRFDGPAARLRILYSQ